MNTNAIAFWEVGVNPITMLPRDYYLRPIVSEFLKEKVDVSDENILNAEECRNILGIGSKKIKSYALMLGETPIKTGYGAFYKKEAIDEIKRFLLTKNKKKEEPTQDYISNPELMEMFNFSPFKAWDITRKHKLKKTTFKGKTIYFNRDKAIDAFSKYQK